MKKMSKETKYIIRNCTILLTSMVAFIGVLIVGLMNIDRMVWASTKWYLIIWFGILWGIGYWINYLIGGSDDSQKEDR